LPKGSGIPPKGVVPLPAGPEGGFPGPGGVAPPPLRRDPPRTEFVIFFVWTEPVPQEGDASTPPPSQGS
jgi:hypothetical protein